MIADLLDDNFHIRLITRNVMTVYSTNKEYTDKFITKLKNSTYIINNDEKLSSDKFISYLKKDYNLYKNIYCYILSNKNLSIDRFEEFLNFFDLNHLLWLHFNDLSSDELSLVEILMQLSTNKRYIILDYIENNKYESKLISLLFHVGLEDKLIIIPYTNVFKAINNSTCQCYVKSYTGAKIESRFSEAYLNNEFNTDICRYTGIRPLIYIKQPNIQTISSYTYSLHELLLIFIYSIKILLAKFYNWRYSPS